MIYLHKKITIFILTLENTEGGIKNVQSRETGNIEYTRRRKAKQKQSRETGNIEYTRPRKAKAQPTMC